MTVFNLPSVPFNNDLVHQAVVAYRANARQQISANKNRSAVSGGGKKPWSQKGSGNARAGTRRSPLFRGGGVTFAKLVGKQPNYSKALPKKMYAAAMKNILVELDRRSMVKLVSDISITDHKTKSFTQWMSDNNIESGLILVDEVSEHLALASRNVKGISVVLASHVDPYSLSTCHQLIITEKAKKQLEERFQ